MAGSHLYKNTPSMGGEILQGLNFHLNQLLKTPWTLTQNPFNGLVLEFMWLGVGCVCVTFSLYFYSYLQDTTINNNFIEIAIWPNAIPKSQEPQYLMKAKCVSKYNS